MSATREIIESLGLPTGVQEIDPSAIERFFLNTINRRAVDPDDAMQAAVLLWAIRRGVRAGDDMNTELRRLLKLRKARAKLFDPAAVVMNSPAWEIVEQLERGRLTYKDAVQAFGEHVALAEDRQIKNWIAAIRPRVKAQIKNGDAMAASAKKRG